MKIKKPYVAVICIFLFSGLMSAIVLNGCKQPPKPKSTLTGNIAIDGKNLVQINCTKCHELVPVDALNKNVWQHHTLPSMCKYFGVTHYLDGYYKNETDTGGLSLIEWQTIEAYYSKFAPDTLLSPAKPSPLLNDWAGFSLKTPKPSKNESFTTMAAVDTLNRKLYTSDAFTNDLTEWDNNFNPHKVAALPSPGMSAVFEKENNGTNQAIISCIGKLDEIDFPNGRVMKVNLDSKSDTIKPTLVESDLARPVQVLEADFNNDGLKDVVVVGQGATKGGVYLLKQNADHTYTQSDISEKAGGVQAIAGDFDHDGWQDLMVLFGTADEGLWLFTNDHKGGFTSKVLLRFPPVYGSTSFQLVDMDHDGKPDLIYTCGYNFHNSRILKPYHGLYIFKNMGDWNFKQQWFYPIDGCTKAIAADFNGNGRLDIATSAFFADMKTQPAESFIYFEQTSSFNFKAHAIPVSKYGRWFSMDVGDYNNDGKPDIILGNCAGGYVFQTGFTPAWNKNIPFIVLQNNRKKAK